MLIEVWITLTWKCSATTVPRGILIRLPNIIDTDYLRALIMFSLAKSYRKRLSQWESSSPNCMNLGQTNSLNNGPVQEPTASEKAAIPSSLVGVACYFRILISLRASRAGKWVTQWQGDPSCEPNITRFAIVVTKASSFVKICDHCIIMDHSYQSPTLQM